MAWGQAPVVGPGDPAIDGSRVKPGLATYRMTLDGGAAPVEIGTFTTETTALVVNGDSLWRIAEKMESKLGNVVDTIIVARRTLAPRTYREHSPEGTTSLDYNGVIVGGEHRDPEGSAQAVAQTLPRTAFDDNSQHHVLAALPLRVGYAMRMPGFSYEDGLTIYDVAVTGEAVVDGTATWTVEVKSKEDVVTYAVSKVDGTTLHAQMNSAGLKMSMTRVSH
jgi:hypothetical protein